MRFTLADVLRSAASRWPARVAVHVDGEPPVSYEELRREAGQVAAALEQRHPGARHVGIALVNSYRWLSGLYGAALAGRTAVLLNPRLTGSELRYQIEQSGTAVLIAGPVPGRARAPVLDALRAPGTPSAAGTPTAPSTLMAPGAAGGEAEVIWADADAPAGTVPWPDWVDVPPLPPGPSRYPAERDTAVIIYTSGTTALPKGVMLAHGSVVRNAYIVGRNFGLDRTGSVFSAGPFFHSGGLTMHVVLAGLSGVPAYSVPAFDPDAVLDFVEKTRPALYNGIETLFLRLTDTPRFDRRRVASVRTGWATGTPAILRTIADEVGMPGIIGVYGISEASPNVTISPWYDTPEHRLGTVGRPQPWTRAAIWDSQRQELAEPGAVGELIVRGYGLMQGYYRKPEETAEALSGGWLHTGDLARIRPDGYLEFAGRVKDIVRMGGENISCAEVENAIYALGEAEIAAVLPIEDPRYGQVPVAVVKPAGPAPAEDDLLARLRESLASYKVPRRVLFLDELPITDSGKVRKDQLRAAVLPLIGKSA